MNKEQEMAICLWYDDEAESAAKFYLSIFKNSEMGFISRYGKEGFEFHKKPEGTVMFVTFRINGMNITGLNGGPQFSFNEASSIVVYCETQEEIDYYWAKLTEEGEEGPCGWLKDKFGVSWQIVPSTLPKMMADPDMAKSQRVANAYLQMKKYDIAKLEKAFNGE